MSKTVIIWLIVVILVVIGGWYLMGRGQSTSTSTNSVVPSASSTVSTSSVDTSTNAVIISGMAFAPTSVTIKTGATVKWTNQDSTTHTVTGNGNNVPTGFDSGNLDNGQSYSFTFDTPGTYSYHCKIHPQMTGTITVQ